MKTTGYFDTMRLRADRRLIDIDWIKRVIDHPIREQVQADGRIRRGARIPGAGGRALCVVLLEDGETVHNAFFDRSFSDEDQVLPGY